MELELANARTELTKSTNLSTYLHKILLEKETAFEKLCSDFLLMKDDLQIKEKTILEKDKALDHLRHERHQKRDMASTTTTSTTAAATANFTIEQLVAQLTEIKQEKLTLLQTIKRTHENHLIELATTRQKTRACECMLEGSRNRVAELEAILKGDWVADTTQPSSKKRLKTIKNSVGDSD
jgi:hypothetical protein